MKAPTVTSDLNKEVLEGDLILADQANLPPVPETTPPATAPDAPEAPAPDAGEGQGPEVATPEAPLEVASEASIMANRGCPSDWNIIGLGDGIMATNRHTNEVYEGSIADFNVMLRG